MHETRILREARLAAGLTYREVGEAARLDPSTLAHYEVGRANPSERALLRWRRALAELLADRGRRIAAIVNRI
jgi:transcriptional regulator with XRE-family HTH domain